MGDPMLNNSLSSQQADSQREEIHKELLETALSRPGVKEAMKVYSYYRKYGQVLDIYRSAMEGPSMIINADSSSI